MYDNPYVLLSPLLDRSSDQILDSSDRVIEGRLYSDLLAKFLEGIPPEFEISERLYDNGNKGVYSIFDYVEDNVKDSNSRNLEGKGYSTERILDSKNNPISCRGVFVTKS